MYKHAWTQAHKKVHKYTEHPATLLASEIPGKLRQLVECSHMGVSTTYSG